jgi:hypothetical protein
MFLRNRLPKGRLDADTKGIARIGTGLIATIAGLVLGLLVASANTTYETKRRARGVHRQHRLAGHHTGAVRTRGNTARNLLRLALKTLANRIWRENRAAHGKQLPLWLARAM